MPTPGKGQRTTRRGRSNVHRTRNAAPPTPDDDEDEDDELSPVATPAELSPEDLLEQLLDQLAGGAGYFASVYRIDAMGEEAFVPGRLPLGTGEAPESLLQRLSDAHGPGTYRLQVRAQGSRGTAGNIRIKIDGPRRDGATAPGAAPVPSPAKDPVDAILALQSKHNEQLMELLKAERAAARREDKGGGGISEALQQLAGMAKIQRTLVREASTPAMPGWLDQVGQVVGPFCSMLGAAMMRGGPRRQLPPGATNPTLPATPPASASSPGAAPALAGDAPSDLSSEEVALRAFLLAEATRPTPDPAKAAATMAKFAGDEAGFAALMEPADFANVLLDRLPDMQPHRGFLEKVAAELKKLVTPNPPTPPAAPLAIAA